MLTAADVDPANVTRQWFVSDYGFGAKHLRDQTIRWLNLGKASGQGSSLLIADGEYAASLFRVCVSCGQLDTATGANKPTENRPGCPYRKAAHSIALSRTMRTEGLVIRLPRSVTLGDMFALPSLTAVILMGLRERIGGAPDHIQVTGTADPTKIDGSGNHEARLLHDIVPSGTGYLAELADPGRVVHAAHRLDAGSQLPMPGRTAPCLPSLPAPVRRAPPGPIGIPRRPRAAPARHPHQRARRRRAG